MTSFVETRGRKVAHNKELTGTTEHVLVPANTAKNARTLESLIFVSDGTSDTVTVRIKNGVTVKMLLLDGATLDPANNLDPIPSVFPFPAHPYPLADGDTITAQCGTGGHLWASAIVVEETAIDRPR